MKKYFQYISGIIILLLGLAIQADQPSRKSVAESIVVQPIPADPVTPSQMLKKRSVGILFAGDTHFEWAIDELQDKNSITDPVKDIKEIFLRSDFRILNLETAISNKAKPVNAKSYVFRSEVSNAGLLNFLDINLAILGNNHAMDMGADGLDDTISNLQSLGIPSAGAGFNLADSASPYVFVKRGIKFAVLSYSAIGEKNLFSSVRGPGVALLSPGVYRQIALVKKSADHVVVSLHWGTEYSPRPEKMQIQIAHAMIDAGATAVIGHHPHIPQGIEFYKNGVIAYSLGNFLFGSINYYQSDNIILNLLFIPEKKTLAGVEIYPITGNYKKRGHEISSLKSDQTENFWKRFYTQCYELNTSKPRIVINQRGNGLWLVN